MIVNLIVLSTNTIITVNTITKLNHQDIRKIKIQMKSK